MDAHPAGEEIEDALGWASGGLKSLAPPPLTPPPDQTPKAPQSKQPATEEPEDQQSSAALAFPQPTSPTLIDPVLQERGWALLPDLARDLSRLSKHRAGIEEEESRVAIKPPDPPEISCKKPAGQPHSNGQNHKGGTVTEATILRSRIPASHKGKEIQEGHNIHGDQR